MTLPNGILVEGRPYEIRTDFRVGLQTYLLSKSEHLDMETFAKLWFPREIPNNLQEALGGILRFYLRRETLEPAQNSGPAAYDFLQDRDAIWSGFQSEYGIDLTDSSKKIHWWRFMALLEGLIAPDLGQLSYLRTADLSDLEPQARRTFLQLRRKFAIKTQKETYKAHIQRLDEIIARGKEEING